MGKKIAIVGAGAVGGYAGAHMVQAGEDVTFIDPWPAHVEHMRKHGLRVTHAMKEPEFTVPVRALHVTDAQAARQGEAGRHRLRLHEVLRHRLGGDADQAISGARRLRGLAAELHERGDDRRRRRLGQDARLHRLEHHGQSAGARPRPSRRRQARRGAYRVSRRRSARPHHATRGGDLPAGRLRRQRQGDQQSVGRALVEARRQRHAERAFRLHRARRRRHAQERSDPPLLDAARQRSDPRRAGARLSAGGNSAPAARNHRARRRRRRRRRRAPATRSASRIPATPQPGSAPRWVRTCRRAGARRSNSSTA